MLLPTENNIKKGKTNKGNPWLYHMCNVQCINAIDCSNNLKIFIHAESVIIYWFLPIMLIYTCFKCDIGMTINCSIVSCVVIDCVFYIFIILHLKFICFATIETWTEVVCFICVNTFLDTIYYYDIAHFSTFIDFVRCNLGPCTNENK